MFENKENPLHLPITQKTLSKDIPSVYDLIFIDTALWTYSLIELFLLFKRAN